MLCTGGQTWYKYFIDEYKHYVTNQYYPEHYGLFFGKLVNTLVSSKLLFTFIGHVTSHLLK